MWGAEGDEVSGGNTEGEKWTFAEQGRRGRDVR